ncbi:MAG: hypothetical protein AAF530_07425 [Pseudomonadota bacterium]
MPDIKELTERIDGLAIALTHQAGEQQATAQSLLEGIQSLKSIAGGEPSDTSHAGPEFATLAQENQELREMLHDLVQAIESHTTAAVLPGLADQIARLLAGAPEVSEPQGEEPAIETPSELDPDIICLGDDTQEVSESDAPPACRDGDDTVELNAFDSQEEITIEEDDQSAVATDPETNGQADQATGEEDTFKSIISRVSADMRRMADQQQAPVGEEDAEEVEDIGFDLEDGDEDVSEIDGPVAKNTPPSDSDEEFLDPDEELIDLGEEDIDDTSMIA